MTINFYVVDRNFRPSILTNGSVYLEADNWDDYSFKTTFHLYLYDASAQKTSLGTVKIGYVQQQHGATSEKIPRIFQELPPGWFSLGQDVEYYKNVYEKLTPEFKDLLLARLHDIVSNEEHFNLAQDEKVFIDSLMRGVSLSVIHGQFRRVINGLPVLTDFRFAYRDPGDAKHAPVNLRFRVDPASKPSTNLHVLIGRNGVGKTTLLNNMVSAILNSNQASNAGGRFYEEDQWRRESDLTTDYFSSVVSVSFSAFDPFKPPIDQPDRTKGVGYFYIGMKRSRAGNSTFEDLPPKTEVDLAKDLVEGLRSCFSQPAKRDRWLAAINRLESDNNFKDMDLGRLAQMDSNLALEAAKDLVPRMSSGHSIVLLTMTKLVDTVEEKTLVLMDEPESHLHPPLLSAFTRALVDLLHHRNGVAIIATHSPVVVQEVPRTCVWKLTRLRAEGRSDRPERETFGENVGVLTREIFGLEVSKSGFHEVLQHEVDLGGSFDSIMQEYRDQLGFEAQAILRTLLAAREAARNNVPQ